ncbi:FecR domain-containing protein [uncultured Parabacteroides sp.]|uniref:FecR family protein n=1 Tax=uncultured Parabacteroides sp. TaxID=512312 RepID=UPI002593A532|nr:FecR domain-containing protein [uncultured Parabacteroides sp.]
MNNQEQSWKGLPEEQLTDKLAGQIRSQADPEAIRKRKRSVQDKIFIQIQQRKKQKERRILFVSIAASLLVLFTIGYNLLTGSHGSEQIAWIEISTPKGVRDSVLLSDGSKIFLNGGSDLKYPRQFTGDTREVSFTGEGYFEIAKNAKKPFLINTELIEVKVLGTKFNLKAYANDMSVETILEEGRVQVKHSASNQILDMKPNDCVTFNKQMNTFSTKQVDPSMATMWRSGKYSFHSTPFPEFAQTLERGFGVTFIIENPDVASRHFTGEFIRGESIDEILNILKISSKLNYQKKDNIITIR